MRGARRADVARDRASGRCIGRNLEQLSCGALRAPRGGSSPTVILIILVILEIIPLAFQAYSYSLLGVYHNLFVNKVQNLEALEPIVTETEVPKLAVLLPYLRNLKTLWIKPTSTSALLASLDAIDAVIMQGGLTTRRFGSIRRGYLPGRFCDAASMPRRPCMHGPCADCSALESCAQAVVCMTISSTERSGTLLEAALERIQARGS